jgi:hypothetical protein
MKWPDNTEEEPLGCEEEVVIPKLSHHNILKVASSVINYGKARRSQPFAFSL